MNDHKRYCRPGESESTTALAFVIVYISFVFAVIVGAIAAF